MKKHLKNYFIPHKGNNHKPHMFHISSVVALAGMIIGLFGFAVIVGTHIQQLPGQVAAVVTSVLVEYTNENRLKNSASQLQVNETLVRAAQLKANDMAEREYFAHVSPDGLSPWHWLDEAGYAYAEAGENLAVHFSDSKKVTDAWMDSPTHRANMLNNNFTEIGIATAKGEYDGKPTIYVVQFFGRPSAVAVARRETPTTEEPAIPPTTNETAVTGPPVVVEDDNSQEVVIDEGNDAIEQESAPEPSTAFTAEPINVLGVQQGSATIDNPDNLSFFERLLVSPKTTLGYAYLILGVLIILSLIGYIFVELRKHHIMHMMRGVVLLGLLLLCFVTVNMFIDPQLLIV